jgi:acyl phosphate:glycerol-3-phosphate acyltransferase
MKSIFLVGSYLLGAIPFGLLISKAVGIDVRQEGSRNIGATNVTRILGKKLGLLTLVCDVVKGYLPIFLADRYLPESAAKMMIVNCCGVLAVIGHMFPLYLRFKGGKGVATGLGVFLFLSPAAVGISLLIFVAVVACTGFVSVGSLLVSALIPLWIWLFGGNVTTIISSAIIASLIWIKHWQNLGRLLRGEEKTWKKRT